MVSLQATFLDYHKSKRDQLGDAAAQLINSNLYFHGRQLQIKKTKTKKTCLKYY